MHLALIAKNFIDWLRESALHVAEMLRIAQVHGHWSTFSTGRA